MSRLTTAERKKLRPAQFALPEKRLFPIHNATHAANAMARLSMSWNMGHLTEAEYRRAHAAIRKAEEHFGVHHHVGHAGARKVVRREAHATSTHAGGGAANMVSDAGYYAATHSGWNSFSSGVGGGGALVRPITSRDGAWRAKAERIIGALSAEAYRQTNTNKDGTKKRRHVPYRIPKVAELLVDCLNRNDEVTAKSIMMHDFEASRAL